MRKYFEVCIAWNLNNHEEGTYTDSVYAADDDEAVEKVAESMARADECGRYQTEKQIRRFVEDAKHRVQYVNEVGLALPQKLAAVFHDELFPDGKRRELDMDALADLLAENRDRVLKPAT